MTDQRNMFLAIVVSMAILFGWDYFFTPDAPTPELNSQANQNLTAPSSEAALPMAQGVMAASVASVAYRTTVINATKRARIST